MTRAYDGLFSRTGAALQGSAIRQMGIIAAAREDLVSFAPGYPDPAAFAWDAYRDIAADLLTRRAHETLQYSPTRGLPALIDTVVPFSRARGIECRAAEVMVTTGSQQGIDLVTRILVDPGDVVLVELPTFTGAIAAFRNAHATLVGIRQDADGLDIDHLQHTRTQVERDGRRAKFLYCIPNFQNPSGTLMSQARRQALLDYAMRTELLIVEDDPYGDLFIDGEATPDDVRPLKASDRAGAVVYLRSTSKTLAPAFRTGWVIGPESLVARLDVAKQSTDLCSSGLDQHIVCEAIGRGVLNAQLPGLRAIYRQRRDHMRDALTTHMTGQITWRVPRGGFFFWATLGEHLDAQALIPRAIEAGVVYVPGAPFMVDGSGSRQLRLAFSAAPIDRIAPGIARLADVITAAVGASAP